MTGGCKGGGGENGMDGEFGVRGCKLLHLEWISNEILMYRTVLSLGLEHDGREYEKKMCVCTYIYINIYLCLCVCLCEPGSLCCTAEIVTTLEVNSNFFKNQKKTFMSLHTPCFLKAFGEVLRISSLR